ncbi:serine hydrolase [Maribellus comscasis]|uniref:Serine hydrolase n=2 Tax=Maribellus comscasis TaxID=2681766 RepID=A0A6I6K451_9BACT|nr:serine hydrolase [Maribellus comscasis]
MRHAIWLIFLVSNFKGYTQDISVEGTNGKFISKANLTYEIERIRQQERLPGISIAIINKSELAYHEVFGVSNAETKEAVDNQSVFEAASLSKPIFAYFVMKMVEQGKIDLDNPLYEYLPNPGIAEEYQEDAKLITARMVLAHQTGLPNHALGEKMKLAFKPGTDFFYSGEAYQYLAAVIGLQYSLNWKKDINTLFKKKVLEPLNMPRSTFAWNDYLAEHKVYGHNKDGVPQLNHPGPDYYWDGGFQAYSSLHSEAAEYANFIIAMLKREGLKKETFDEMLKEQTRFSDDNPLKQQIGQTGWGLGFAQKADEDYTMHMHTGNNHDFQAYAMFIPEKEYGVVVFTNSDKMIPFLMKLSEVLGPQF